MHAWIRLTNLQIAPRIANALLDRFGDADDLFAAAPDEIVDVDVPGITDKTVARILDPTCVPTARQLDAMDQFHVRLVTRDDPAYPRSLKDIPDAPVALYVRGELEEKDRFAVALVGSRNASAYGKSVTDKLARDLSNAGLTVVSGGAIGIDAAAHRAVLEARGRTLVILGTGLDVDYPRENRRMFESILEDRSGALVSEFPMGSQPEPWHFPMRNRIISGLSMGVVVVEAGAQSGALLTAGMAGEQGREIMAVPGNVDRLTSRGANALIRDGAVLVENAQDILRTLGVLMLESPPGDDAPRRPNAAPPSAPVPNLTDSQKRLLAHLTLAPRHIDALAADMRMASPEVSVQLTLMELSGVVRRLPGNCYIRIL
jgi:DNA processing protein